MSQLYLIRIVIETTSPMAINTGGRETGFDSQLARDANNLPYIPATAIAGVWQSIAHQYLSEQGLNEEGLKVWFGHTDNKSADSPSQASSITLSDGVVLNSRSEPAQGLIPEANINQDEVLSQLIHARPHHRERVSINDRGVAKETGKFDQILLPTGVRFCIDIKLNHQKLINQELTEDAIYKQWAALLNCWQHPLFSFGASTRNGLGKFKIIGSLEHIINLTVKGDNKPTVIAEQLRHFAERKVIPKSLQENGILSSEKQLNYLANLELQAIDNWRCGTGSQLLNKTPYESQKHNVNIISYSESSIEWDTTNRGRLGNPKAILCGSSIKGILAHRIAFHLRRFNQQWAEKLADEPHEVWQEQPRELEDLFGYADDTDHKKSQAGRLYVEDCELNYEHTTVRQHNSIDRFTGGVRKGALFSEELLYQPIFTLKLSLQPGTELSNNLKKALLATLEDLKIGLLPMGAGSGRGTSLVHALNFNNWDLQKIEDIPVKVEQHPAKSTEEKIQATEATA